MSYTAFSFLGIGDKGDWAGLALLVSVCLLFIMYIIYLFSLIPELHPGRYIFVCRYCTPASKTSFACARRDASNDTCVHYYLRNIYSSCIQVIPSCPLNGAIEVCIHSFTVITYKKCDTTHNLIKIDIPHNVQFAK
jgi:hypothetical protein